jgi:uncharacterized repeat protein (TIGR02543 family)
MKTGSKITGNKGGASGGGVYVSGGTFEMSGGTISGNTTTGNGGGVYVMDGTFTKSGGVIYGSDVDSGLKNTATGNGPAVYVSSGKKRISTAGEGVTLNSGTDANWEYTVTFDADGGTPTTQSVVGCGSASLGTMPTEPSRSDYTFLGWYTARNGGGTALTATTTVSADITVYAWWTLAIFSLQEALDWLKANAAANGNYTITVSADESIVPNELSYSVNNVSVTLVATAERTVSLSSAGTLFTIGSSVTLTLDNNVTLQEWDNNTASLVRVNSGGPW